MNQHRLRSQPESFDPLFAGQKRAEFRRDDRAPRFDVGDTLILREWQHSEDPNDLNGTYTGRYVVAEVTHIDRGAWEIPDGYAVLSLTIKDRGTEPWDSRLNEPEQQQP